MNAAVTDAVWKALADPTRRRIVDVLQARAATTGALTARFAPQLARTAVMKHLDVLEAAALIRVERSGRRRWNHLDPEPLAQAASWLARRSEGHRRRLGRLKDLAENRSGSAAAQGGGSETHLIHDS